jgi:hypothetical protein
MPRRKMMLGVLLSALLSACAAVTGVPSIESGNNPGGFKPDGTYVLSDNERSMSCRRISGDKQTLITEMKGHIAQAKTEQATIAPTALGVFKRSFGGAGAGLASLEAFDRKSAIVDAYDVQIQANKCPDDSAKALAEVRAEAAAFRTKR